MPQDPFEPLVVTADDEELPVLYDMGEVVVGSVAHVSEIDRRRAAGACGIDQLAECAIFIPFPRRLYHKIGEPPVEDGVKSVDMDLIEPARGLAVRLKIGVRIVRVPKDVNGGPVARNELVLVVVKLFCKLVVEHVEEVGKSILREFFTLLVKGRSGRGVWGTSEEAVDFFCDAVCFHSEEHEHKVVESYLPIPCEVSARIYGILFWIGRDLVDRGEKDCFDSVSSFHNVPP